MTDNPQRPAPDALLMAQLIHTWPQGLLGPGLFFYRMVHNMEAMKRLGYKPFCGIGQYIESPSKREKRTFMLLSGTNEVKMALVFVPDEEELGTEAGQDIGRDIPFEEWERARWWLNDQAFQAGVEYGRQASSDS